VPLIHVSLARGRSPEQKRALLEALTRAAQDSIGAPLESIRVWITEVDPDEFMSAGQTLGERRRVQQREEGT
jgi:4-oxalocrotonate tautomerase